MSCPETIFCKISEKQNEEQSETLTSENEEKQEVDVIIQLIRKAKKKLETSLSSEEELTTRESELTQILKYLEEIQAENRCPEEVIFAEIIEMASANLFRRLPYKLEKKCSDAIDEALLPLEPAWKHLDIIYSILQQLVSLTNDMSSKYLRFHVTDNFVHSLFELFDSSDPRERNKLKVVVHRMYSMVCTRRPFIRRKIKEKLLRHVYDDEPTPGIYQILQVYGCVVSGFNVPLKEEHVLFLEKVLIPLHKSAQLAEFHEFLTYAIVQFLYKEPCLLSTIVSGILKYWPKTCSQKEVLFLKEIEGIIQVADPDEFKTVQEALFTQIGKCVISPHFQVAENSLSLWKNQRALFHIVANYDVIMPIVFPSMFMLRKRHWNQNVTNRMYSVFRAFLMMDRELFEKLVDICREAVRASQGTEEEAEEEDVEEIIGGVERSNISVGKTLSAN